jgi:hypothetical protein
MKCGVFMEGFQWRHCAAGLVEVEVDYSEQKVSVDEEYRKKVGSNS